jgi:hypothetical protein
MISPDTFMKQCGNHPLLGSVRSFEKRGGYAKLI